MMFGPFTRRLPTAIAQLEAAAYESGVAAKQASDATPTYSLAGRLVVAADGCGVLDVPGAIVRGLHRAIHEPGVDLPCSDGDRLTSRIVVLRPDEVERLGGADQLRERGRYFRFQLGRVHLERPRDGSGVSARYLVAIQSPQLKQMRRTYGLPPALADGGFQLTIGVRKVGALGSAGRPSANKK